MKLDISLDKIQDMVMDSHMKAAKQWCDKVAARMTEMKLKTDINRQFRSTEYYPQEPEPAPQVETFEIRAPWVEELLSQTRQSGDSEIRAELEAQKQKQMEMEAKIEEMAENQRVMKEQQAELLQNQTQTSAKMDTMLELLLK